MNSIAKECDELKRTYEECFNAWFTDHFLKGRNQDACSQFFRDYQSCVKKAIKDRKIDLCELDKNVLNTEQEKKPPAGK